MFPAQAAAIQREILALEDEVANLKLKLEKVAISTRSPPASEPEVMLVVEQVPSESAGARAIESQIASARERLVELRLSQSTGLSTEPPALSKSQLEMIFEFYANFGRTSVMTPQKSLDSFMFMKFCRECPDLMDPCVLGDNGITFSVITHVLL